MSDYLQTERAQEWRETIRKSMKNKDRTNIPRVVMPEVDPEVLIPVDSAEAEIGGIYPVTITEAMPFELIGRISGLS